MAQTKAQRKRAIEGKKYAQERKEMSKSEFTSFKKFMKTGNKTCQMCGKNSKDKHSDYCKSCNAKFKRDDEKSYDGMMRKKGAMGY